jgi:hypothetical protein
VLVALNDAFSFKDPTFPAFYVNDSLSISQIDQGVRRCLAQWEELKDGVQSTEIALGIWHIRCVLGVHSR